jgi:hypothetical protein
VGSQFTYQYACVLSVNTVCEDVPAHLRVESLLKQHNSFHGWASQITESGLLMLKLLLLLSNDLGPMDDSSLGSVEDSILHRNSDFFTAILRSSKIVTGLCSNMLPLLPLAFGSLQSDLPVLLQLCTCILMLVDLLQLHHGVVNHEILQDAIDDLWIMVTPL